VGRFLGRKTRCYSEIRQQLYSTAAALVNLRLFGGNPLYYSKASH